MGERKLASLQIVDSVEKHPNADRLDLIKIKGWQCVCKKNEFVAGDHCVYFEIDSILPRKSWSEFLVDIHRPDRRIRLKTVKLRKEISQGLALPLDMVGIDIARIDPKPDTDLTDLLGVTKYIQDIPANLQGERRGNFPDFIFKTDEERVQNFSKKEWLSLQNKKYYISEKLDGSSFTCYDHEKTFGVCSRNIDLKETDGNKFWEMARKYNLEEICKDKEIAIQGEVVGQGIQKNRLQLEGNHLYVFNVFDIKTGKRYDYDKFIAFCKEHKLNTVPIIEDNFLLDHSIDNLVAMADGKSTFGNFEREGIVFRELNNTRNSFKTISNKYLLKE